MDKTTDTGGEKDPRPLIEQIETDIYSGKLAPGMWLKQIDLEERYQCTRLTLRHALEQLQARKIVQRVPNRGYYVPSVDQAYANNVRAARAHVEKSIVDELITNITGESLARLSYLASVFSETLKTGTLPEQDEANLAFHRELLTACKNPVMIEIIWDLRRRVPLSAQRASNTPAELERSARDHFEMIECLRTRDADRLRVVTERHVGARPVQR
ncbi:GntR family transcriptional regulator [Neorhizobium alkalisoli]|uniref:DNA-binding GntR family transcriptional regulator n=1 Tax=Neorhizobium alkalisoli TaxID=528178 RepID=A0A561R720_9HYPH|nr:GntR family transcriptional regulator [Neorhizobium alkalisoli]TWF58415.1 DNA-binding GntR family transcriptional regulator [Neorhizobium alkalisoli]